MVPLLAAISFLSPLFLIAALALAIPLIIHLLERQRVQQIPFSTLRFLRLSAEKTAHKRRLRNLLLLLFRMAVVVFLAIGLSRPLVRSAGSLFGQKASAVVLVLDNSPSMALADGGEVRFERARRLALKLLDGLHEGDQVAVLLTGGPGRQQEMVYHDVANAERLIEEARVSLSAADLPAAIRQARTVLAQAELTARELYVFTDLQQSGWSSRGKTQHQADDEGHPADDQSPRPPTVLVDVHRQRPVNLSLEQVSVHATVPAVGMPRTIVGRIRNGSDVAEEAQVKLSIAGQLIEQSSPVRLAPGQTHTVTFTYIPHQAGIQEGRLRLIGDDASDVDNQRSFVLETFSAVRVALVSLKSSTASTGRNAAYYVKQALETSSPGSAAVEVAPLEPLLLSREPLGSYSTVICADIAPPGTKALAALRDYVSAGGTLLWICGPNNDPATLAEQDESGELFPGQFRFVDVLSKSSDSAGTARHWADLDVGNPILKPLAAPASLFLSVTVERYLRLTPQENAAMHVLARLDNGDPAMVSHPIGQGTVYTLTTGAQPQWTTLPLRPIFLPLLNRLVLRATDRQEGPQKVSPGGSVQYRFADEPETVTLEVSLPNRSEPTRLTSTPSENGQTVRFDDTFAGGVYQLRMVKARHPRRFAFAVNFDSSEADPRTISADDLATALDGPVTTVTDEATLLDSVHRIREGTPLEDLFLFLVLIAGIVEIWISNRIGNPQPLPYVAAPRIDPVRDVLRRAQTFHQLGGGTQPPTISEV